MLFSGYFWARAGSGHASRTSRASQSGVFEVRMCPPSESWFDIIAPSRLSSPGATPKSWRCRSSARAHEIPLADLQAVVPEDVVRGRDVKVEVGQGAVLQQLQAGEVNFAVPRFYGDGLAFRAVDLPRLDRVQPRNR